MPTPVIIFENEDFLVINKPSGMVVHPFDYSQEETLVNFLQTYIPTSFSIENNVTLQDKRVIHLGGIVHKLDRDTSGIMVIAKNKITFNELKDGFRNHTISKTYRALVEGNIEKPFFTIDAPLGRAKKDYRQTTNKDNQRGEMRSAVTDVEVLIHTSGASLVKLIPKTGRTHQLRAHMSSIGHPIIGDKAYGSSVDSERIMLHAESLSFTLKGERYSYVVEPPKTFTVPV